MKRRDEVNTHLVYDVGMNNGDDTAYYLARGFKVVAIEAAPDLAEVATKRFAQEIRLGQLTILNLAIAEKPGVAEFWICEESSVWNSFFKGNAARDGLSHHKVEVQCETLERIFQAHGVPHFLKVDIEGNDLLCLNSLEASPERPQYVSFELGGDIDRFLNPLTALGFSGFKLISQFNFIPIELPAGKEQLRHERWKQLASSSSLGARALKKLVGGKGRQWITKRVYLTRYNEDWFFPDGSSGPFAEDTPGRWLTAQEARDTYRHYAELAQRKATGTFWNDKSYSFWVDLHARRQVGATQQRQQ